MLLQHVDLLIKKQNTNQSCLHINLIETLFKIQPNNNKNNVHFSSINSRHRFAGYSLFANLVCLETNLQLAFLLPAHWVVHQWRLYERSLCSLLELQARKGTYSMCCSPRYVLAPEYPHHLLPLPLTTQRASPPPAHL